MVEYSGPIRAIFLPKCRDTVKHHVSFLDHISPNEHKYRSKRVYTGAGRSRKEHTPSSLVSFPHWPCPALPRETTNWSQEEAVCRAALGLRRGRGPGCRQSMDRDYKTGLEGGSKPDTVGKQTKPALYFKKFILYI